jgi:hypothetical protein
MIRARDRTAEAPAKRQHSPSAQEGWTAQRAQEGGLMTVFGRIKSLLGSKPANAPPERHLSAETEAGLSASLRALVTGAKGWVTLEEARRLFSPMDEAQYAFGEMDDEGRSKLGSFAAQNRCTIDLMPEGRIYFTRQG